VILYLHGGGYVLGNCATHRNITARIAVSAASRAIVPEYRLAPEHRFPAPVEDAIAVYDALLDAGILPSELAVAGDSAGGGLAAAFLLSLRDSRRPLPKLAVLISPWTDLTLSGDSYRTRADLDPVDRAVALRRMVQAYLGSADPTDPLASPIFGNLHGLPPLLIQAGDHEVLLDDSMRFARQARAAGVDVELQIWPEMWHGWQLSAPELPEANEAIGRIGSYIRTR
jgi:acetyl esterase/lipase